MRRTAERVSVISAQAARRFMIGALMLAAALFTAANASAAEVNIRLTLDRAIEGPAAPFLLALDKGYYKAEGLNVGIDPGERLLEPITRVASGTHEMGFADINALIKFRDANPQAPVKAVFIVYNRPAYAVIGRKSRGVIAPKDLEGRKLGAPSQGGAAAQWPVFAKANGVDLAKVQVENVAFLVREPMLAAGQVDAITGLTYQAFIDLKDKGVPLDDVVVLRMADYGVDLYGEAIIVNTQFAAQHPDAVRGFLRAFVKGLRQTARSPEAAVDIVLKYNDSLRKPLEVERLKMVMAENILTEEVNANGLGGIDQTRFAHAIGQIASAYRFRHSMPKPQDIFDAGYLPAPALRKGR